MANKIMYGLDNVYYAKYDEATKEYSTPVAWPGAVSLSLDAEGDTNTFYADNLGYFVTVANNGYSGDFESAIIPESFKTDIMGEVKDSESGLIVENANAQPKPFALLFQFTGDVSKARYVLYNCKMARPSIESQTTEDSIEVKTVSANITATPLPDGKVKGFCEDTSASCYANWFQSVVTE